VASDLEIMQWRYSLATHLRNRRIALGSIPAGLVLLVVTFGSPAMIIGIVAALAGPVLAYVANTYVRDARIALGQATAPKRLPTARIV
jgi:hypothetical protein